jgi:uncharacterized ion transporter superfamily protein YfcC
VITILVFLILVGVAFQILEKTGILQAAVGRIVNIFGERKYLLLLVISFFFMMIGAFFGIFEEVVPLVPLIVALANSLGWDVLVGLGMSVLATNMGFSAAITNPFTIGVAQRLAGLPLFSGAWLRVLIFLAIYTIFAIFLVGYAKKIDRHPEEDSSFKRDGKYHRKAQDAPLETISIGAPYLSRALGVLAVFLILILGVLIGAPFVPILSQLSMPLVGLMFFLGGMGAGLLSGTPSKTVFAAAGEGLVNILPAIPLILMAASARHIVSQGRILDTLLHGASQITTQTSPFVTTLFVYLAVLLLEIFISSGSAKAFLIMPILLPLADIVGVTRQVAVTAYCFGDGFSNLAYPTNPVLLICLGLTGISYPKWLRWTMGLWPWVILITILFLGLAVLIGYGPF